MPGLATWDLISELPVLVEEYAFERRSAELSNSFQRVTTVVRLKGGGHEGLGEDVSPFEGEDDTLHVAQPELAIAGEHTVGTLTERIQQADVWLVEPRFEMARRWRNWAFESAVLDLALNQAGLPLHEALGRDPRPVRFVNSLGLGEPPTFDPISRRLEHHPDLRFKLDATTLWTPELIEQVAATGAVEIIDFKGRYGMDLPELPSLVATYERVIEAFPDALLEDAHELPEIVALLEPRGAPRLLRRPDRPRRGHRLGAHPPARGEHQAVPRRRPAVAVRRLRGVRGAGPDHLRRRHGRARRRPPPDPAARLALPPRRAERHRARRLQRRHAGRGPPAEPAAGRARTHGLPPRRGMNRTVVLLGPPGSGKGTQAERLHQRLGFTQLATGVLLRAAREEGTDLGRRAGEYMDRGDLVPDDVIVEMIRDALADLDGEPVLLDGFPRTVPQAEALEQALGERGRELTAAVLIDVPDDLVAERIMGRGQGRSDDDPETVRERLQVYHRQTEPLVSFYEDRRLLRRVDGAQDPDAVEADVRAALE